MNPADSTGRGDAIKATNAFIDMMTPSNMNRSEGQTGKKIKREEEEEEEKKKTDKELHILYANSNGIRNKIKSLETTMKETECDIAFITETKGEPPIITGYKWYTKNRQT